MRNLRFAPLLLTFLLAGCPKQVVVQPPTPPINADHSITLAWNQSFANNGACSTTVTTSCISGFNEGYISGTAQTQLHTDTAAVCTGTTQPEACTSTFNGVLPIGSVTFYLVLTYVDQNGAAQVLPAVTAAAAAQVAADAPTGLVATVQ